ncbi:MAG: cytidylyltransferase domain-containing protein, partial [Stellaceae bacterium]
AVLTRPDHPSGSDRVFEAVTAVDPRRVHDVVVNVQGDLPIIAPAAIRAALVPLDDASVEIATLAAPIKDPAEIASPSIVKVAAGFADGARVAPALYFSRLGVPWGEGAHFHHIGVYAYRRAALERFVTLPPSPLERREGLEQLRALEAGIRIAVALVDAVPLGVDTPEDLARARALARDET